MRRRDIQDVTYYEASIKDGMKEKGELIFDISCRHEKKLGILSMVS